MYTNKINDQLDKLYRYQTVGRISPLLEEKDSIASTEEGVIATYGEITRRGVDTMIDSLGDMINKDTVFYDLGSGYGTLTLHICIRKNIKKATGVEYFQKRRDYANNQVERWTYRSEAKPKFVSGNYFNFDFSDASVVYWDNILYLNSLESKRKLIQLLPKNCIAIVRTATGLDEYRWRKIPGCTTTYQENFPIWWAKIN